MGNEPVLGEVLEERNDGSVRLFKELLRIRDPAERKRYLADMSAKNHPLAMTGPRMKTAGVEETEMDSFELGVAEGMAKIAATAGVSSGETKSLSFLGGHLERAANPKTRHMARLKYRRPDAKDIRRAELALSNPAAVKKTLKGFNLASRRGLTATDIMRRVTKRLK